jgi:hypothetical protein
VNDEKTFARSDHPRGDDRPLFVPLKTAYFEAFANGSKTEELRRYGPRWNERTCVVGRPVVLSKGYGKAHRLDGRIGKFKKQHGSTFGSTYRAAIQEVFGTLDIDIACFAIQIDSATDSHQEHAVTTRRSEAP